MREDRQGVVTYDLTAGSDGSVVGCRASGPPGSADLERATCDAILARARFNLATDEAGRAVVGEVSGNMRWTLPD
ncbi:MAG: energy transducer TonB [Sphingopyxis sp.]|nr:energy transducer TonB [Sphingopyxis sp.]